MHSTLLILFSFIKYRAYWKGFHFMTHILFYSLQYVVNFTISLVLDMAMAIEHVMNIQYKPPLRCSLTLTCININHCCFTLFTVWLKIKGNFRTNSSFHSNISLIPTRTFLWIFVSNNVDSCRVVFIHWVSWIFWSPHNTIY